MRSAILAILAMLCLGRVASADVWKPSPDHMQIPLWPASPPDAQSMPGPESMGTVNKPVAGEPWTYVSNISVPTLTVYSPKAKNTGAAVMVFPGGGFEVLAIDLEGTEVCDWLTSKGITCILLKYRVPSTPYDWSCDCRRDDLAVSTQSLEDAQRAMGLARLHAALWHIDPHRIGVIGFSAGGYLVAEMSTRYRERLYAPIDDADKQSARPDFAVLAYPGHLAPDRFYSDSLNRNIPVTSDTPPTFLVQAEDDKTDGANQSLAYYVALRKAGVPTEMHLYAGGGHAFGLRHSQYPITEWPKLVERWLNTIGIISD